MAATALGWLLCSWLVQTWRMFRAHRKGEPYTSPCYLWLSGAVVLADLTLVMVGILMAQNSTFGAVLPVACILALRFLHQRLSHSCMIRKGRQPMYRAVRPYNTEGKPIALLLQTA